MSRSLILVNRPGRADQLFALNLATGIGPNLAHRGQPDALLDATARCPGCGRSGRRTSGRQARNQAEGAGHRLTVPRAGDARRRGGYFGLKAATGHPRPQNAKGRPVSRAAFLKKLSSRSVLRVEFDDEVRFHHHRIRHIAKTRCANKSRGHFRMVCFDVIRHVTLGKLGRFQYNGELL